MKYLVASVDKSDVIVRHMAIAKFGPPPMKRKREAAQTASIGMLPQK